MDKIFSSSLKCATTAVIALSFAGLLMTACKEKQSVTDSEQETLASINRVPSATFAERALPGTGPFSKDLRKQLFETWERRPPTYQPRTKHLHSDGSPVFTNRLFLETSPYLLQHAHNPVNWYPWGDEAFETAARLKRPVLLSVGYSTCHWCHVMEEESSDDVDIARYLNENYVAVKVDRERRPDVDSIYMAAVNAMTGRGGWPMTVWLTPDRKPFYGGTYFPPHDGPRGVGFLTLLRELRRAYDAQPNRVREVASRLTQAIEQRLTARFPRTGLPTVQVLESAFDYYAGRYDPRYGGLRGAPKFPSSLPVRFLLRYLEDYAFAIAALLDLYEATGEERWLSEAIALDEILFEEFEDHEAGGYYFTSHGHEQLLAREKPIDDGAMPSGNSVQILNLLRLFELTFEKKYRERAEQALRAFGTVLERSPAAVSEMLLAVDFYLDEPKQIVIVAAKNRSEAEPFLERLRGVFLPNRVLAVGVERAAPSGDSGLGVLFNGKTAQKGDATAYVCLGLMCKQPTRDPSVFEKQILETKPLKKSGPHDGC